MYLEDIPDELTHYEVEVEAYIDVNLKETILSSKDLRLVQSRYAQCIYILVSI